MNWERDKDLAWIIVLTSFLVFLFSGITSSFFDRPLQMPLQVTMANASLQRAFLVALARFTRQVSLITMVYGGVGLLFWPPGARR